MKACNCILFSLGLLVFGACAPTVEPTPAKTIEFTLLDSDSFTPANVTLFFKADYSDGSAISDLSIGDITILEDNETISSFEADRDFLRDPEKFTFSTVLLLDLSGSVLEGDALTTLKSSAKKFVLDIVPKTGAEATEMAIFWFDGETNLHLLQDFTRSQELLLQSIEEISPGMSQDNSTNLHGAVVQGLDLLEARLASVQGTGDALAAGSLLLFTDGKDRASRVTETTVLDRIKDRMENVTMLSIGLGGEIDASTLEKLGPTGFALADDINDLQETFELSAGKVKAEANSFYIFQYCSPKRAGTFNLRIEANKNEASGSLESTFSAERFTGGCQVGR